MFDQPIRQSCTKAVFLCGCILILYDFFSIKSELFVIMYLYLVKNPLIKSILSKSPQIIIEYTVFICSIFC